MKESRNPKKYKPFSWTPDCATLFLLTRIGGMEK